MLAMRALLPGLYCLLFLGLLAGCDSPEQHGLHAAQLAQRQAVMNESPGDYYIGRRYYDANYKFWGYLRRPGQPWKQAQLVMLNETQKLAPDREVGQFGIDNNSEYKIYGHYSGESVYEPVSNRLLPEFVLTGYELRDRNPTPIFPPGGHGPGGIQQPD